MEKVAELELNNGNKMPVFGFGTWQLSEGREAVDAITTVLEAGYRLIDTAKIYGNERSIGEAINASGIPREEIFVTTKLWTAEQGYDSALTAFDESLQRLGLDYIDLYLIHWPGHDSGRRLDSWRAFEEIQANGRVKNIGVSNFMVNHLHELAAKSNTVPSVNQIEFHPFIYDKQAPVLEYCAKHNIVVEAYSPLARGRKVDDPRIGTIAEKHGKSNAQVMLRWALQHKTVPIPKSSHPGRIKENLDVFDFELTKQDMAELDSLGRGRSALPFYVRLLK